MSNENKNNDNNVQDAVIIEQHDYATKGEAQLAQVEKSFATLFENSDMKKHLAELKKKYGKLKVTSLEDKDTYEEIKKAISVVRPLRTGLEKKSKELKEDAQSYIKSVNSQEKFIQSEVAKIENPLWAERDKYEAMQKVETERIERESQERYETRMTKLKSNGLKFDGEMYSIREISIDAMFVKGIDDEKYNSLLEKVKVANTLNVKEEEERQAEAERQRVADELEKQKVEEARLENERIQNELKKQQDDLKKQMDDFNRMKKEEEDKIQAEKDKIERERKQKEADEAKAELEKQQEAERLAEQKRIEEENKIIVERTTPLNGLLAYNFNTKGWSRVVGDESFVLFRRDVLADDFNPKEYAEKVQVAITKHELKLEQERQSMLNDTQKVTEYISKLQEVQVPLLENSELNARLKQLVKTIGEFK
jgi:hypothetical protein